ncbi:precorrin-2 C(20)-methyltransferase [Lyngbya confervoides]|uniref:Precorrin-2 C(20)-methyltransferase n=1 Tax=Lyngbya confervoides BDU141951 TaxID=1574623 RepID=A0ABD4T6J3_9CYAN|nr:precorrin-2 C(20)-methyltransferase [Lyngbya confervoides]MCM1983877.1 precorrin-2 C(20)-methyltransferase [Lyngbya confervoides BDU141951]
MSAISPRLGQLYGISVGPGDPELITVKGLKRLQTSPVVAFPAGVRSPLGVAQRIIQPWLQPHQTLLPLDFPMVQDAPQLQRAWDQAAHRSLPYLQQGQDIAFVSEGDVSFYSTYTYLALTLKGLCPDLKTEAIPGVCSPLAAAAALEIPLTIQSDRLVVLPALYQGEDLAAALEQADVLVLMKVGAVYAQVWQLLQRLHLLDRSALIVHASQPQQKIYRDLTAYAHLAPPYFSLMIVQVKGAKF